MEDFIAKAYSLSKPTTDGFGQINNNKFIFKCHLCDNHNNTYHILIENRETLETHYKIFHAHRDLRNAVYCGGNH